MPYVISAIAMIIAIFAISQSSRLLKEMKKLYQQVQELKSRLSPETAESAGELNPGHETSKTEETSSPRSVQKRPLEDSNKPGVPKKPAAEKRAALSQEILTRWIGIAGTVILVAGISFLGIYSTLRMQPLGKFLSYSLSALAVFGITYITARQEKWRPLSLWLRSGAGAVVLFSCVGSVSIAGLAWITDPFSGVILIAGGIALNLLAGYTGKRELIALVHLLMSMVALSIAPATAATLLIAALITLAGMVLTFRHRWEWNLIFIISEFFIFHLLWFIRLESPGRTVQIEGISFIGLFSLITLLLHYRKIYRASPIKVLPFLTHFLNWVYLGIGLVLYKPIISYQTLLFLTIALSAYMISRKGKKLEIAWLRITDSLVGNLFLMVALLSLESRGFTLFQIAAMIFLESLIFLYIMIVEKESLLILIAYILSLLSGLSLFALFIDHSPDKLGEYPSMVILLCFISLTVMYILGRRKEHSLFRDTDLKFYSLLGMIPSLLIGCLFWINRDASWSPWMVSVLALPLLWLRRKETVPGITLGLWMLLIFSAFLNWTQIDQSYTFTLTQKLLYGGAFFLSAALALIFSYSPKYKRKITLIGLIALNLHLIVMEGLLLKESHLYLAGFSSLLIILIYCELAVFLSRKLPQQSPFKNLPVDLGFSSIVHLLFFNLLYFSSFQPSKAELWGLPLYLPLGISFLITAAYWLIRGKGDWNNSVYAKLQPLLLEVFFAFLLILIFHNPPGGRQALITISAAILTHLAGRFIARLPERTGLYATLFFWLSILLLLVNPGKSFIFYAGMVILQISYLVLCKRLPLPLSQEPTPLGKMQGKLQKHLYFLVFYPFFAGLGLLFLLRGDSSYITLMLVLECLLIYILSLLVRETHFMFLSLIGLAGCLVRLLLVDLSQSGTITRALVFIGVGLIMILMYGLNIMKKDT